MISVKEAREILISNSKPIHTEEVDLLDGLGRILAIDIFSKMNVPSFNNSAMDGYCFQWKEGQNRYKIQGQIQAGDTASYSVNEGCCYRIYTGAMMPEGANTVVQQEWVTVENNEIVFDASKIEMGANVRLEATQSKIGDVIAQKGIKINPSLIGLLASVGVSKVSVFAKPKVSIVITGDELVELGEELQKGQIYNSNEYSLKALLFAMGITQINVFRAADTLESVKNAIQLAKNNADTVIVTGGISVGDFDFVKQAMLDLEIVELFYKIKQKPGKPLWVGRHLDQWFFALPGNPAAVVTCFNQYVKPVLGMLTGNQHSFEPFATLPCVNEFKKKPGLTHFLKGYYTQKDVTILTAQESFNMESFNRANCIVEIPENVDHVVVNSSLLVYPLPD